ncbi:MAG: SpoVR family protein [Alphaproteobacteria bacterium]|nr:SpoVR family protein [Alphaproteobacteria bacterium]
MLREGRQLAAELVEARDGIRALAKSYGLDFFDVVYEMVTYEEMNMLAAYGGFPTRYPHWRFGMDYIEMQKSYEYGLSKIYEMVINTDPSYAYLLDNNLVVDQKLVMAHVYGHVDFFKNNLWFAHTNRKMLDQMANHATRVRAAMDRQGQTEVEKFIDVCLSIDNLIDPYLPHIRRTRDVTEEQIEQAESDGSVGKLKAKSYMDPYVNPPDFLEAQRKKKQAELDKMRNFPESPVRDVMGFLLQHAPLPRWKQEILQILRDEAYYFAPQAQTKIMNEGWATYWHTKLMTRHILSDSEVVDYADHHSGTVYQQPGRLNPYKMGVELFRHIEERWNKGRFGKEWTEVEDPRERARWDTGAGLGREKIFEVRRTHNDVTFLDTFLTADFCREQGFFTTKFDPKANEWVIDSREFEDVKKQLLMMLATRGNPRVYVIDANHGNRSELRMWHEHEGSDIQLDWAQVTMANLYELWGRTVHLDTLLEGKPIRLSHDGTEAKRSKRDPNPGEEV